MKAIINVHKNSIQAKNNGLTFEVKEVLSSIVALDINGITTDFSFKEVFIVDLINELQKARENRDWGSDNRTFANLQSYITIKGLNPELKSITKYYCPA